MNKYVLCLIFSLVINAPVLAVPTTKINLKVIDEDNVPIEGANAGLRFILPGKGLSTRTLSDKGLTDSDGLYTGSGESGQYVGYGAGKDGYYSTSSKFRLSSISGIMGFRRWEPWNPTIVIVLKKKINPIAMYAVRLNSNSAKHLPKFPVLDRFIGYDLIAGDWVVPHGLGTHRDFLFKLEKHQVTSRSDHHVTLALSFSNEGDGIQSYYTNPHEGSNLRLPHHAPSTGYESELIFDKHRTATKIISGKIREDQNYFFRVRTEKDEKGNIIGALYGKIHGEIEIGAFIGDKYPTGAVFFDYYINPNTNDTNVEFDPMKNLFKDLTQNEEVMKP